MNKKTRVLYIILAILFALTFVKGCEYSYGTDNGSPQFESFYSSVPMGGLGAYQIGGAVMLLALIIGFAAARLLRRFCCFSRPRGRSRIRSASVSAIPVFMYWGR